MKRLDYIDTAKGIGILLVVWFHMESVSILCKNLMWGGVD